MASSEVDSRIYLHSTVVNAWFNSLVKFSDYRDTGKCAWQRITCWTLSNVVFVSWSSWNARILQFSTPLDVSTGKAQNLPPPPPATKKATTSNPETNAGKAMTSPLLCSMDGTGGGGGGLLLPPHTLTQGYLTSKSTYICRVHNSAWRLPKYGPPHPRLHPASVSSPRTKGVGGYTLTGRWGGGGSIFWKTPDIGLASCSLLPLHLTYSAAAKLKRANSQQKVQNTVCRIQNTETQYT